MVETIHTINTIVSNPQIRSGAPCIAGTGVRVTDVVMAMLYHQRTPDEIATDYGLSLAQVYAALSFYYDHKHETDVALSQQIAKAKAYKQQQFGVNDGATSLLPR